MLMIVVLFITFVSNMARNAISFEIIFVRRHFNVSYYDDDIKQYHSKIFDGFKS